MLAIFLDGESKSGKTAVGRNIRQALSDEGYTVRLVVAGHFFRLLTKLILDDDPTITDISDDAIKAVLDAPALYDEVPDAHVLDTPEIDHWVSRIGQRDSVQDAANGWREKAAQRALDDGVEIVLLDGRNLRTKLGGWAKRAHVPVALELLIACRPEVAAARYLGRSQPTPEQLRVVAKQIAERRDMDRHRSEAAYLDPAGAINLRPGIDNIKQALQAAWAVEASNPPRPIRFDNSDVPLKTGLATVTELAVQSVEHTKLQR